MNNSNNLYPAAAGTIPSNPIADAPAQATGATSWGAIFAGATAAAALSLILLMLGAGLGLSSVSPWSRTGPSAEAIGLSTILWITFAQLFASGFGGYLAGRLRTKWVAVHTDEVYFRDTAHGFLAWAVATLVTAAALTSAINSIVGGGLNAATAAGGGIGAAAVATTAGKASPAKSSDADSSNDSMSYFVDSLFRKSEVAPASGNASPTQAEPQADAASTAESARILVNGISAGTLPPDDLRYLGSVVSRRTSLSQQDAERRVSDVYTQLQTRRRDTEQATTEAVEKARKASAHAALWLFISLLFGAFVASLSATFGGRQRDL